MWKPNESIGDDASGTRGVDPQSKRRRSRRRAWHEGVANQTVVNNLEDVRSYRAFERALIGSVDPRSALELALAHRLASLLWRLHRANAIEMGLFEIQGEIVLARWQDLSREPSQVGTLQTPTGANGHSKVLGSNGRDYPPDSDQEPPTTTSSSLLKKVFEVSRWATLIQDPSARRTKDSQPSGFGFEYCASHVRFRVFQQTARRPPLGPWSKSRAIAQCFLRLSR